MRISDWSSDVCSSDLNAGTIELPMTATTDFIPLALCVLTVSDSRGPEDDSSGDYLANALREAGHRLPDRALLPDDRYCLRAPVSAWLADPAIDGLIEIGTAS